MDRFGEVKIDYGATSRSDALVGLTPGGGAADPGPTDLSRAFNLSAAGTTYQRFLGPLGTNEAVDLSFRQLKFRKP
jgi:hypothetical protein